MRFGRPHPKTYSFEVLSYGFLGGQDGWPKQSLDANNHPFEIVRGTGVNQTRVLARDGWGGDIIRGQNAHFRFKPINGSGKDAILQCDMRYGGREYDAYFFAGGEGFGMGNGYFSILRGGSLTTPAPLPADIHKGDWLRLRLHIDFTANQGRGAGRLEYSNLTKGDLGFSPIPELQDVQLWTAPPQKIRWDVLHINMRSPLDGFAVDNLVPNMASSSGKMETTFAIAMLIAVLSLWILRRHRLVRE